MKKILIAIVGLLAAVLPSRGQTISDVVFRQNDEGRIVINYNLKLVDAKKATRVKAYMSLNDGPFRQLRHVSGDVGTVSWSGLKTIDFDVFKEYGPEEIAGDIAFSVRGRFPKPVYWAAFDYYAAESRYSEQNTFYGFSVGYCNPFGGYLRCMFGEGDHYDTYDSGSKSSFAITLGPVYQVLPNLFLYAGAGYGRYVGHADYVWSTALGGADRSYEETGCQFEGGAMVRMLKFLTLSAGYGALTGKSNWQYFTYGFGITW